MLVGLTRWLFLKKISNELLLFSSSQNARWFKPSRVSVELLTPDIMTRVMTELAMRKEMTMAKLQTMFYFDADKKTLEGVIETLKSMKFITSKFLNNEIILTYLEEKHDERAMPEGVSANRDGIPRAMLSHEKSRLTKPSGEPYLQCPNEVRSSVEENSGEAQPGLGDNTAIPRQES